MYVVIVETSNGQPHFIIPWPSRQSSIQWHPRITLLCIQSSSKPPFHERRHIRGDAERDTTRRWWWTTMPSFTSIFLPYVRWRWWPSLSMRRLVIVETNNGQPHIIIPWPSRQSSIQWNPRIPYFVFNPLRNLLFTKEDISVQTQNEPLLGDERPPSRCPDGQQRLCNNSECSCTNWDFS